ncbi:major facilitator superfamily domain-containing protein [Halteromyces radiatus]|uniref:major facilitator superfamily domain-containing protein n=1 Tax=Halteromyces radiatus TaxID=101107 RepID=UPI00221E9B52|nr:major facilitator superfamily domain-containing protein [Halteromyces radiatus]KAI8096953.1 major facilitator superfamily domain-containing protein [Halteromyces radiatus]
MNPSFTSVVEYHEQDHHHLAKIQRDIINEKGQLQSTSILSIPSIEQNNNQEKNEADNKTSMMAWLLVVVVILINSSSAMMWMTASSVPVSTSVYFNISLTQVNWISNVSAIINTVFSLPCAWIYEKYGLKFSIILAGLLNMIGCWLRCIAILVNNDAKYAVLMLGQFVASFGGPLVYNIAAKLTAVWFAAKDRSIANTLISLQVGMVLAPLVIPQIVKTPDDVPRNLLILAGVATVVTIPSFFLPSRPEHPPTKSALAERMDFIEGMKQLAKNSTFRWILLLASLNMGMAYSVSVLIIEAIMPLGYSDQDAGICAAMIVIAGFVGGFMSGYWAGKTAQYLMLIKMFAPFVVFSYVIFIFQIIPNAFGAIIIACLINGFFSFGIFPVMLEFSSEVTYPVPESISSCVIWTMVTTAMLIFSVMIDALRAGPQANPPNNMTHSMVAVAVVIAVGFIPVIWLKGDLKRLAVDTSHNDSGISPDQHHHYVGGSHQQV